MAKPDSAKRLRGAPLLLARIAAIAVSLGVVALVAMQAGLGGCASAPGISAEPESDDAPARARANPAASTQAEEDEESGYMGGAKAPAGGWAKPRKKAAEAPQAAPPSQQPPSQQK